MQLSYRGINYNQNPVSIKSNLIKTVGKYRGRRIQLHIFNNIGLQSHPIALTYRGFVYR